MTTADRIAQVHSLDAQGVPRATIIAFGMKQWGVTSRTVETYLSAARTAYKAAFEESLRNGELRTTYIARLEAVHSAAMKDKKYASAVQAMRELKDITGLATQRIEITGAGGGPVTFAPAIDFTKLSDEEARVMMKLLGVDQSVIDVPALDEHEEEGNEDG